MFRGAIRASLASSVLVVGAVAASAADHAPRSWRVRDLDPEVLLATDVLVDVGGRGKRFVGTGRMVIDGEPDVPVRVVETVSAKTGKSVVSLTTARKTKPRARATIVTAPDGVTITKLALRIRLRPHGLRVTGPDRLESVEGSRAALLQSSFFEVLAPLDGELQSTSFGAAITEDGVLRVVGGSASSAEVGFSAFGFDVNHAVVWEAAASESGRTVVARRLDTVPAASGRGQALRITRDGAFIGGSTETRDVGGFPVLKPAIWPRNGAVRMLGLPSDTTGELSVFSMSDASGIEDMKVLCAGMFEGDALRWTEAGGFASIPGVALLAPDTGWAFDMSADGSVLVGFVDCPQHAGTDCAAFWGPDSPTSLPDGYSNFQQANAFRVSPNGRWAVGYVNAPFGNVSAVWDLQAAAGEQLVATGTIGGPGGAQTAKDVTDSLVVVGGYPSSIPTPQDPKPSTRAYVWFVGAGDPQPAAEFFASRGLTVPESLNIEEVSGVREYEEGFVFVGNGHGRGDGAEFDGYATSFAAFVRK